VIVLIYVALRLVLWAGAVAIAMFPTLQAAHVMPSFDPKFTMAGVNGHGNFRDLFFVIVPAAAVSLSSTMEFLCTFVVREALVPATVGFIALLVVLANTVILLSGFVGFLLIPPSAGPLAADAFTLYSTLIIAGLGISLGTELGISGLSEVFRA
jgi:hypothetical protein